MDATGSIAVIIATVGRADALTVCLRSLAVQTRLPAEVLVVHSGADAGTREVCGSDEWRRHNLPVRYLPYPRKSAALQRDYGVRQTACPLVMFADDDMEFEPAWVATLFAVVSSRADVGAAMGDIVNQPMSEPTALWRVYRRLVAPASRATRPGAVVGALVPNGFPAGATDPIPCEWIGGCITLLRKDAYLSVGGFAPHYRGSSPGEDVELGYRMSRRWALYYVPAARCLHHQSPLGRENMSHYFYQSMRSRYAFCRVAAGRGQASSLFQIALWAAFQTVAELAQVRRARLRPHFLSSSLGRVRGWISCLTWDPAAESFPDGHDTATRA